MKSYRVLILITLLISGLLAACNKQNQTPELPPSEPSVGDATESGFRVGTVSETMDSGGYTYVLVDDGKEEFWAAAPAFVVSVGETITVPPGMPMANYRSNTLNRDFDLVYFVQSIQAGDVSAAMSSPNDLPPGHPNPMQAPSGDLEFDDIVAAEGELTIEEIYSRKAELDGKQVAVRGKVVKFNAAILGTNWLHVRDGSGEEGTNDLTVTADASVSEGDTVVIKGVVHVDRDLGSGYFFPVIIENANVTIE